MSWVVDRASYAGNDTYRWVRESHDHELSDRRLVVIGKNPSTADNFKGDSTSRAVERWAEREGFGRVCLLNLFALRSPKPRDLEKRDGHEVNPENDDVLRLHTEGACVVVVTHGRYELAAKRASL